MACYWRKGWCDLAGVPRLGLVGPLKRRWSYKGKYIAMVCRILFHPPSACQENKRLGAKSGGSEEAEGACPSAGANGPLLVCSQVLMLTPKLSFTRLPCPAKPSAPVTCNSIRLPRSTRRSRRILQLNSTTGFRTPWSTKGKSCRFSPL